LSKYIKWIFWGWYTNAVVQKVKMHVQHKIKILQKVGKRSSLLKWHSYSSSIVYTGDWFYLSSLLLHPLVYLGLLMILLHRSVSHALFHHEFASRVLRSFNTESSHLNLGLPFFLLPSGWEKIIFMQGTLLSILALCPNHWRLAIVIIFTMLGSFHKLYSSLLYFILHTPLTRLGP